MILENLEIQKVTTMKEMEKPSSIAVNFMKRMEERRLQKEGLPMVVRDEDIDPSKANPEFLAMIRKLREEQPKKKRLGTDVGANIMEIPEGIF